MTETKKSVTKTFTIFENPIADVFGKFVVNYKRELTYNIEITKSEEELSEIASKIGIYNFSSIKLDLSLNLDDILGGLGLSFGIGNWLALKYGASYKNGNVTVGIDARMETLTNIVLQNSTATIYLKYNMPDIDAYVKDSFNVSAQVLLIAAACMALTVTGPAIATWGASEMVAAGLT